MFDSILGACKSDSKDIELILTRLIHQVYNFCLLNWFLALDLLFDSFYVNVFRYKTF